MKFRSWVFRSSLMITFLALQDTGAQLAQNTFAIYLHADQTTVKSGAISVRDAGRNEIPKTDYHRSLKGEETKTTMIVLSSEMAHNLKPGESMMDTIEVNDLCDLSLPGSTPLRWSATIPGVRAW